MSSAPVDITNLPPEDDDEEEMPKMQITREHALIFGIFVLSAIAFLYFVLPQLSGLDNTWERIKAGDPWWLAAGLGFEAASFGGYVWLFRTVFVEAGERDRINWRASYQITMAGLAATRLFAAAGAGGVALTAWALRRSGMDRKTVAARLITFLVLLYLVYVSAMVVCGLGLRWGIFHGESPWGFTVVPAFMGGVLILAALALTFIPGDVERRVRERALGQGRIARWASKVAAAPQAIGVGVRGAVDHIRKREPGVLGAVLWWGFDIAVLWACFHAFGDPPPGAVIVTCYFVGMIANTLPLPGGIGGVEGGMIGTFIAFGIDDGLAVVAVLAYRGFSFWLPTVPGAIAYLQLRRTVATWREERAAERRARNAPAPGGTIQSEVST